MNTSKEVMTAEDGKNVWRCLNRAVERFNLSIDRQTLLQAHKPSEPKGPAASERAITHRLAFYLECELRAVHLVGDNSTLVVDCEYNRHGAAIKALSVEEELKHIVEQARNKKWDMANEDGFYVFSISPDIVVHQRGTDDRNRLVVELKKASNPETPEYDELKLKLFTRSKESDEGYGYNLGAWIIADDEKANADRKLRIEAKYKNGEKSESM